MKANPQTVPDHHRQTRFSTILLLVGIFLIAANLRAPITGIAPLLDTIRGAFSLGTAETGVITTLPLLAFAFASPFCVLLAREYGLERSLFMALAVLAAGLLVRSLGPIWALYLGTAVIGIGIAIANVLLPSLLKRDFPDHIALLTGLYALMAGLVSALLSALIVPVAMLPGSGWQWALGSFLLVPIAAMALWSFQLRGRSRPTRETASPLHGGSVWRSVLAWQVTLFFGLNSLIYYVMVTWLPAMLIEAGYSAAQAGSIHGASQLATAVPGLLLAPILSRLKDQRFVAAGSSLMVALSLMGLLLWPDHALFWAAAFGVGSGGTFILALSFIGLRAANAPVAAALSGMVQTIGYTIAATAPPALGALHDLAGGWKAPLGLCIILCLLLAIFGYGAGRGEQIGAPAHKE